MAILVISDIHANLTALEAVLADAGEVDAVWCLGDLVGYGPDPNACVERIRSLPNLICLMGNHDAAVLDQLDLNAFNREAMASVTWTRSQISIENLAFLGRLKERKDFETVTLSHGSPRNPIWEYLLDLNTVEANFSYFSTPYCFVGHTHIPVQYISKTEEEITWSIPPIGQRIYLQERAILNPGSVGQPRDRDARAAYALFDPQRLTWEARRVVYDYRSVQTRIINAGLPQRHASRLAEGW
ncbi:MAG TPA: metallophosphoesterase family protein [Bellilinea sp.]|jgi:predicted phosphodiesterase|nr:metallophosphoesterase family protein [Bellilinea sp.]